MSQWRIKMTITCLLVALLLLTNHEIRSFNISTDLREDSGPEKRISTEGLLSDKKDLSISFPIHFRSFQSFFRTNIRLSKSSFSIYFQIKTKMLTGLLMLAKDEKHSFLFCVELHHGKIRYIFKMDSDTKVLQRPLNVSDGRIHEVHIQRPSCQLNILRVDNSAGPSYTSGKTLLELDDADCEIHIGGTSGYMYGVLPDAVRSTDGYIGCMSSIDLDGNPWSLVMNHTVLDEKFKDQIVYGCDEEGEAKSIAEYFPHEKLCGCRNGGLCRGGACDCKLTTYSGRFCEEESEAFNFSSGDVIVFRFLPFERPDNTEDVVVFGIKTQRSNGSLVIVSDDHFTNTIKISLLLGKVHVWVMINRKLSEMIASQKVSDGEYHVVRFFRVGSRLTLQIDNNSPQHLNRSEYYQDEVFHKQARIIVGGMQRGSDLTNEFNGLIAGLFVNKLFIFDMVVRNHSSIIAFGNFSSRRNLSGHKHKTLHKDKIFFSRTERLPTYPSINRLVADDDIIVPTLFGGECEDVYDSIPEFCGHNLSDDSFVYPSSMRKITWKTFSTTRRPKEFCNASTCPDHSTSTKVSLKPTHSTNFKSEMHFVERLFTLKSNIRQSSIPDDSLIVRKFHGKEDEVVQENYNYIVPDHLVSSMITNILLTIGISTSSIVLVIVMLYVAKKCSKTKKTEVFAPEEFNKFITHSQPQVSTQSFLNVKHPCSESYVKEWFI